MTEYAARFSGLGERHAAVTATLVRSGQPRPYADHEHVYRIRWSRWSWDRNLKDGRPCQHTDEARERAAREFMALMLLGAQDYPRKRPGTLAELASTPWVEEIRWVDDDELEITTMRAYID